MIFGIKSNQCQQLDDAWNERRVKAHADATSWSQTLTLQLGQLLGGHDDGQRFIDGAAGGSQSGHQAAFSCDRAHITLAHFEVLHPDIRYSLLRGDIAAAAGGIANTQMSLVDEHLTRDVKVSVGDVDVRRNGRQLRSLRRKWAIKDSKYNKGN